MPDQHPLVRRRRERAGAELARFDRKARQIAASLSRSRRQHLSPVEISRALLTLRAEGIRRISRAVVAGGGSADRGRASSLLTPHIDDAFASARALRAAAAEKAIRPAVLRRDLHRLIIGQPLQSPGRYGLKAPDVSGLKTVVSDTRRILVSETNAAIRGSILARFGDGELVPWVLSGRHKDHDECDDIAAAGPYRRSEWPDAPHPYCGCMPGEPIP